MDSIMKQFPKKNRCLVCKLSYLSIRKIIEQMRKALAQGKDTDTKSILEGQLKHD